MLHNINTETTDAQRAKSVVPPGIEPGTFSVLTRCHNQLDHGTDAFLVLADGSLTTPEQVAEPWKRGLMFLVFQYSHLSIIKVLAPCNTSIKVVFGYPEPVVNQTPHIPQLSTLPP
jgi:hypothetical protein